jgi:hypothetical protein
MEEYSIDDIRSEFKSISRAEDVYLLHVQEGNQGLNPPTKQQPTELDQEEAGRVLQNKGD